MQGGANLRRPGHIGGGSDGEASGLSKRRKGLKMPVQFLFWHEGAPNIRQRKIKKQVGGEL